MLATNAAIIRRHIREALTNDPVVPISFGPSKSSGVEVFDLFEYVTSIAVFFFQFDTGLIKTQLFQSSVAFTGLLLATITTS